MPGRGSYGPGGKWVHDRAEHILGKNDDLKSKGQEGKSIAYALATQQAHKVNKSPKRFRTAEGVREAKRKYNAPASSYVKTPDPKRSKSAHVSDDAIHLWLHNKEAAAPPPAIPTPQFPLGLQRVRPSTLPSQTTPTGKPTTKSIPQNYTQVHSQPPASNPAPYTGVKAAPPPSVKP